MAAGVIIKIKSASRKGSGGNPRWKYIFPGFCVSACGWFAFVHHFTSSVQHRPLNVKPQSARYSSCATNRPCFNIYNIVTPESSVFSMYALISHPLISPWRRYLHRPMAYLNLFICTHIREKPRMNRTTLHTKVHSQNLLSRTNVRNTGRHAHSALTCLVVQRRCRINLETTLSPNWA